MPVNKNAYRRYQLIDELLQNGQYPSLLSLQSHLDRNGIIVSLSTLEKDIDTLRNEFELPVIYDRYKQGYHYYGPNASFSLSLSLQDMETIMLALDRLKILHKSKALINTEKSLQRIMKRLHYNLYGWNGTARRRITYDPNPDYSGSEILSALYDAISEKRVISFTFNADGTLTDENLDPYVLNQFQGKWYLAGFKNGYPASYPVDNMTNLVVKQKEFERKEKIPGYSKFENDHLVDKVTYISQQHPVCIRFDASLKDEIIRHPFQRKQEIVEDGADGILIRLNVNIDDNFVRKVILPYAGLAVVCEPPYAIDLTLEILNKIIERQKKFTGHKD